MRDLNELCCANRDCPDGGKRGKGDLTVRKVYEEAILAEYGVAFVPPRNRCGPQRSRLLPRTGRPGRPKAPCKVPSKGLLYATVHKTREKGRVVHDRGPGT